MGQTANQILGGGTAAGGLALTAMGMPEIGIPMMIGGASGGLTGKATPTMMGGLGGGLGAMGAFGGPNQLSQFLGGTGNAPVAGMEGPPTAPTSGAFGMSSLFGGGGTGGMADALKNAAVMKSLLPQQQTPQQMPVPPPIQRPPTQQSPAQMTAPSSVPMPMVPQFVG